MLLTPIDLDVLEEVLTEHVGRHGAPEIFAAYDEAMKEARKEAEQDEDEICATEITHTKHGRRSWTTAQVLPRDLSDLDAVLLPTGWHEIADIWTDGDLARAHRDFATNQEFLTFLDEHLGGDDQHVVVRYFVERAGDQVTDAYHVFRRPELVTVRVPAARVPLPPFERIEAGPHRDQEHPGDDDAPTQHSVSLVLRHADYAATWFFGDEHVSVWLDVDDWDNFPDRVVAELPTNGRRFTAQTLTKLTDAWLTTNPDALTTARAEQARERS